MAKKQFPCMVCEKLYAELEEAEACEFRHEVRASGEAALKQQAALRVCAFCDSDPCGCTDGRHQPEILAPVTLLKLGALTLQTEQSHAVDGHLADQELAYREALERYGPEGLITALLERDKLLLNQGRTIADGRMLSRLTRELVRAALYAQGGRPDVAAVQKALEGFGAEPTDLRQLALHGSTLGALEEPGKVAEGLADGTRKQR